MLSFRQLKNNSTKYIQRKINKMNATVKNYLNKKIELNALVVEMKKYGTVNATLNKFYCFDNISIEQHNKYRELKKTLHYINTYFVNYVKMKRYIINNNITLEYAQKKLNGWEDLKFRYNMIDKMNREEERFYDNIIHKVNRYSLMVEILKERS
jgi:hypothetical protein